MALGAWRARRGVEERRKNRQLIALAVSMAALFLLALALV